MILKIKRLSSNVFFLAQVQLSTRKSIRVYHVSKMFPCRLKKLETLLVVVVFLVSLAHRHKSVKLKKHKHKKSNVSRISVCKREKTRKNIEKRITNLQSTIHYKKNPSRSSVLSRESLASRAQAMPAKRLKRQKRHKNTFC